jgi:hypothetical protein
MQKLNRAALTLICLYPIEMINHNLSGHVLGGKMFFQPESVKNKHCKPLTSLAILADDEAKWHPRQFSRA